MTAPIFKGWIEKGYPNFNDETLAIMLPYFEQMEGDAVTMCVKKFRKQRSNLQNAYYWGVIIKMICDHSGYQTREEYKQVHDTLRGMFLRREGLWGKEITLSTSALDTVEFEKYQKQIRQWAAIALDLYIPEPNECEIPETYQTGD